VLLRTARARGAVSGRRRDIVAQRPGWNPAAMTTVVSPGAPAAAND
jgi:hypothetical protein